MQIRKSKQPKNTAKQNYPGSVASYNTRPGNDVGLFYIAPEPTRGGTQPTERFVNYLTNYRQIVRYT